MLALFYLFSQKSTYKHLRRNKVTGLKVSPSVSPKNPARPEANDPV